MPTSPAIFRTERALDATYVADGLVVVPVGAMAVATVQAWGNGTAWSTAVLNVKWSLFENGPWQDFPDAVTIGPPVSGNVDDSGLLDVRCRGFIGIGVTTAQAMTFSVAVCVKDQTYVPSEVTDTFTFYTAATSGASATTAMTISTRNGVIVAWTQTTPGTPGALWFDDTEHSGHILTSGII